MEIFFICCSLWPEDFSQTLSGPVVSSENGQYTSRTAHRPACVHTQTATEYYFSWSADASLLLSKHFTHHEWKASLLFTWCQNRPDERRIKRSNHTSQLPPPAIMMLMSAQLLFSPPSYRFKAAFLKLHVNINECVDGMFAPGGNDFVIGKIME